MMEPVNLQTAPRNVAALSALPKVARYRLGHDIPGLFADPAHEEAFMGLDADKQGEALFAALTTYDQNPQEGTAPMSQQQPPAPPPPGPPAGGPPPPPAPPGGWGGPPGPPPGGFPPPPGATYAGPPGAAAAAPPPPPGAPGFPPPGVPTQAGAPPPPPAFAPPAAAAPPPAWTPPAGVTPPAAPPGGSFGFPGAAGAPPFAVPGAAPAAAPPAPAAPSVDPALIEELIRVVKGQSQLLEFHSCLLLTISERILGTGADSIAHHTMSQVAAGSLRGLLEQLSQSSGKA